LEPRFVGVLLSFSRDLPERGDYNGRVCVTQGQKVLEFFSASTRKANGQQAIMACPEVALSADYPDCDRLIIKASIGHHLREPMRRGRSRKT
jgi:hypothetical protein